MDHKTFSIIDLIDTLVLLCQSHSHFWSCSPQSPSQVGEGEDEVAVLSAKRWERRRNKVLIESATPHHGAQVMGSCPYRASNPLRLTVLTAKSEDYTITP